MTKSTKSHERVPFRHLHMPCCNIILCWVNPRRPMYCPECGARIFNHFPNSKWMEQYSNAWLEIEEPMKAEFFCSGTIE
jgi:hypothetical protein